MYYMRDANGNLVYHAGQPTTAQVGAFTGKAGSITRTRKGATRRSGNGRRNYLDTNGEVVMYSAARIVVD